MSIKAAGGTIRNTTFTSDGTRSQMQSTLVSELSSAGWSTVSGGGTSDTVMKSAVTPQGAACRVRVLDPGANNCVQVTFQDSLGANVSAIAYMLPTNGKQFRIIANKYQFFMFSTGNGNTTVAREIVMGGVLYLPPGVASFLGANPDNYWAHYTGNTDTTTTARTNFRSTNQGLYTGSTIASALMNGVQVNYTNGFSVPRIRQFCGGEGGGGIVQPYNWINGAVLIGDTTMFWGSNSGSGGQSAKGLIWDAFLLTNVSASGEAVITGPDGNTYMVITNGVSPQLCVRVA